MRGRRSAGELASDGAAARGALGRIRASRRERLAERETRRLGASAARLGGSAPLGSRRGLAETEQVPGSKPGTLARRPLRGSGPAGSCRVSGPLWMSLIALDVTYAFSDQPGQVGRGALRDLAHDVISELISAERNSDSSCPQKMVTFAQQRVDLRQEHRIALDRKSDRRSQ